jgi:signal transduction histidine kinase
MSAQLQAGDRDLGAIAVARSAPYADTDRLALAIFGSEVAHAVEAALLRARRESAGDDLERAHERAVEVLMAVSSHAAAGQTLTDFLRRLARTLAGLVHAKRVLFWRLDDDYMLSATGGYGVDSAFLARLTPTHSHPDGDDLASKVVHQDLMFRANSTEEFAEFAYVLERLGVKSAISVPWRAGDNRLGLVAAYDSTRTGAFTRDDMWVLQTAGQAAALVTLLWQTEEDLRRSVDRLSKVDSARQLLLKNMTTVVERERKRFVSELHDDALQKLTAVELQLERLAPGGKVEPETLEKMRELLRQTETSLRRLVFDVRPPALESPDGLEQSIRDRIAMLAGTGIKSTVEIDLPSDLSLDVRAMLFRQVAEAVGNAERHSKAKNLTVSLKLIDGGVRGLVVDDGQGFVVAERSNVPGHLGLLALRERALMAGGWYNIESEPGAGTHVEFWVPLK